jgi:nucleotide-binding universal stress UspA family protein
MLEKIMVPLDGSSLGELALLYVKELAPVFNSEVHLVSVCERRDAEYRRMIQLYVEKVAEQVRDDFGKNGLVVNAKPVVLDGDAADKTIIEYSQQKQVGLVIIVSHGHSGIMPWTMGSTANKIVQNTLQPILLVRATMFNAKRKPVKLFNKILVPLDGSAVGEAALPYVSEIARRLGSEVTLFSVVESGQHVHTIGGRDFVRFTEQQINSMRAEIMKYQVTTSKKLTDIGVNVQNIIGEGNAAEEIIKFAKAGNIRLVAMSSHGKSGLRGWVFGSVSNKVLHSGKTPLLLVRAAQ